jgi:hypothetical protein
VKIFPIQIWQKKNLLPALTLTTIVVVCAGFLFFSLNYTRADITTGLVGWWKFDEGSGTTIVTSAGRTVLLINSPK